MKSSKILFFRLFVFTIGLTSMAEFAQAQWQPFKRLRERIAERRMITQAEREYDSDPTVVLRRQSGVIVDYAPRNPVQIPSNFQNYDQRMRVLSSDGTFENRYYGSDGQFLGGNWLPTDVAQSNRISNEMSRSYNRPIAPSRSNNGSSSFNNAQARYNNFQSAANNMINNNNASSQSYRQSSMDSLNSFGNSIRNSMSGGSESGTLVFDDNAPGKN